jgi:hypothetical protein
MTSKDDIKGLVSLSSFVHGAGGPQSRQSASFFSSRRNWDSPNPSPAGECAPSLWFRGEGHTFWRERGGRVNIPKRGHTLWYSTVYLLFVRGSRGSQRDVVYSIWTDQIAPSYMIGRLEKKRQNSGSMCYVSLALYSFAHGAH